MASAARERDPATLRRRDVCGPPDPPLDAHPPTPCASCVSQDGLVSCIYRVAQEGLPSLMPYLTRQTIALPLNELVALLKDREMLLPDAAKVHITRHAGVAADPATDGAGGAGGPSDAGTAPVEAEAAPEGAAVDNEDVAADGVEASEGTAGDIPGDAASDGVACGEGAGEGAGSADAAARAAAADADAAAPAPSPAAAEPAAAQHSPPKPNPNPRRLTTLESPESLKQMIDIKYGCCIATLKAEDAQGGSGEGGTPCSPQQGAKVLRGTGLLHLHAHMAGLHDSVCPCCPQPALFLLMEHAPSPLLLPPPPALGLSSGAGAEGALTAAAPIAVSCWRGRASLNVLVSKQECAQIVERLSGVKA